MNIQSSLLAQPLPLSESHPTSHTSAGKAKLDAQDPEKVAKDFESVFASMLLKEMRNTLEPGVLFSGDSGDVYGGLFDQFMGQHMSESGGLGLSNMIRQALSRPMAVQNESSVSQVTTN